jgi:hypothetical protein
MTFNELDVSRDNAGRFSEKVGGTPEVSLAASGNPWASSRWDNDLDRGDRPMRPYLPLQPADDDEFFDAPRTSVLTVVDPKVENPKPVRYQKFDNENWTELNARGEHIGEPIPAGELWNDLNYGDWVTSQGFKTARLDLPLIVLYSDASHYVYRERIDKPLSKAEAGRRFEPGAKFAVVSQAGYDVATQTYRNGGVSARMADDRTVVSSKNGRIKWDSGSEATITPDDEVFDRGGDIVISSKSEYGVETVYRRID